MSAEARIAALPLWRGKPEIEPIAAGRTNRNFLVRDGNDRYFARIGADIPQHGISRAAERRCAILAARAGIGPRLLHADAGFLIAEYVDGIALDTASAKSPELLAQVAALLQRLHAIPAQPDLPGFCPVAAARLYLSDLADADLPIARARIDAALRPLPSPSARCLIHGDLIPENFIRAGDRLWLVDWEYAGNGAPETDLAMVISNFGLADRGADDFLQAYGACDRILVQQMRIAAVIREALWCLMQARIGGMVGDLPQYTALCLERLERVLR